MKSTKTTKAVTAKKSSNAARSRRSAEDFFDEEDSGEEYQREVVKSKPVVAKAKPAAAPKTAVKEATVAKKSTSNTGKKASQPQPQPLYESEGEYDSQEGSYEEKRDGRSMSPGSRGVKSISDSYKEHYEEYVADSQDSSEDNQDDGENTPEKAEKALIKTIKRFATYVSSITADLEKTEQDEHDALRKKGKTVPRSIWADSTFKIDFTKGLLLKVFKPDRLMKYYIVFLMPMRKWLEARNEEFFLKAKVFPGAPEEDIRFFRDLWSIDGTLSREEKDTIWDYWDTQITIVDDWEEMTGWTVNPDEKLNIPDIDYEKAARDAGIHE